MKIYTGFGDKGKTRLYGGDVVNKDHPRINLYGTLDELNSWLGLIITQETDSSVKDNLIKIQNNIFTISSEIAAQDEKNHNKLSSTISSKDFKFLEEFIDTIEKELDPLKNFILPGGCALSANYHIARTICRRAERHLVNLINDAKISEAIPVYVNRLSDLLFVLARYVNKKSGIQDSLKTG